MIRMVIALMLLVGCSVERPPLYIWQAEALEIAEYAWVEAGLPDPGDCLKNVRVFQVSKSTFERRCDADIELVAGCLTTYRVSRGQKAVSGWAILIAPDVIPTRTVVVHEALHALVKCTLRNESLHTDPYDAEHADPRVWAKPGDTESVERIAAEVE